MTLGFKTILVTLLASITLIFAAEEQERRDFESGFIAHMTPSFERMGVRVIQPNIQSFLEGVLNATSLPPEGKETYKAVLFLTFKAVEEKRISGDSTARLPETLHHLEELAGGDHETLQAISNNDSEILQGVRKGISLFNKISTQFM